VKRAFTTFSYALAKSFKGMPENQRESVILECIDRILNTSQSPEQGLHRAAILDLEYKIFTRKCIHFFVPGNGFSEWLLSCAPKIECVQVELLQDWVVDGNAMVFHFPCAAGAYSFACQCRQKILTIERSLGAGEALSSSLLLSNEGVATMDRDARLVTAIGMYINCFPEMVRDGAPQDIKHPSMHSYRSSKTICVSPEVIRSHASPSAHFRHGHFRVLRSEKFTNKRFQTIFIKSTFVSGKAKTVIEP
jgi:hypothetical protein